MTAFRWLLLALALGGLAIPVEARKKSAPAHKSAARSKSSGGRSGGKAKAASSRKTSRGKAGAVRYGRSSGRGRSRYVRSRSVAPAYAARAEPASDSVESSTEVNTTSAETAAEQGRAAALRGDNAEALSRYLHVLSRKPDDPGALIGAGRAALEVGDLNAATGFLAHAQDIAPQNGQVEAGLGAIAIQNNDPRSALRYLKQAEDHGVSVTELASDRALAYDLRGDPRRAQGEYALALRAKPGNAALLRRLALSQAIAGDRLAAFNTLDPLLRRQDVAAWRTRAFVRAMTGDLAGAQEDAAAVVPAYQLEQLKPYLARLAVLRPADKAAAVNLGRFPQPGAKPTGPQIASASPPPRLALDLSALGIPAASAPSAVNGTVSAPVTNRVTAQTTQPAPTVRLPVRTVSEPLVRPAADTPSVRVSTAAPAPIATAPAPIVAAPPPAVQTVGTPVVHRPAKPAAPVAPAAAEPDPAIARAAAARAKADARATALAAQKEKERKAAADTLAAEKAAERAATKANPARSWVQVAGGANKADLPKAWTALKKKWPQLAGRSPWTMHYRFTNRLLIGPFPSTGAAQAWVSEQNRKGFATFRVDTDAGEAVERLGG